MEAKAFAAKHGQKLIGRRVHTEAIGNYPGGAAKVVALHPDPVCPEIVIEVQHATFGPIGIFEDEEISFAR